MTPHAVSELSLPWLNAVLSPQFNATLSGFSTEVIGGGAGLLGELARISLTWDRDDPALPKSLIGKFSAHVAEAREVAGSMSFYEMEHRFYTTLSCDMPIHVPQCFFGDFLPDTQQFALLITDVDGTVVDQIEGCSKERAERAVDALVALHVWGALPENQARLEWVRPVTDPGLQQAVYGALQTNTSVTLERLGDTAPDWLPGVTATFPDRWLQLTAEVAALPKTLLHGDFRADNLVFNDAGEMTLLDWQILLKGHGAYDLGYFMSQSLATDVRRECGDALIERYVEGRAAAGAPVDPVEFDTAFRSTIAAVLTYPLVGGAIIDENYPRSRQLAQEMLDRACAAAEDYDVVGMLQA